MKEGKVNGFFLIMPFLLVILLIIIWACVAPEKKITNEYFAYDNWYESYYEVDMAWFYKCKVCGEYKCGGRERAFKMICVECEKKQKVKKIKTTNRNKHK